MYMFYIVYIWHIVYINVIVYNIYFILYTIYILGPPAVLGISYRENIYLKYILERVSLPIQSREAVGNIYL